jgi:hypothetical protein
MIEAEATRRRTEASIPTEEPADADQELR